MILTKGIYKMAETKKRHNKNWEIFKDSLELTKEELAQIELKTELIGKIIAIRKELGLTQTEFAEKSSIKQEYLARLESSKSSPQIDTLLKILIPLGYKLDIVPI